MLLDTESKYIVESKDVEVLETKFIGDSNNWHEDTEQDGNGSIGNNAVTQENYAEPSSSSNNKIKAIESPVESMKSQRVRKQKI